MNAKILIVDDNENIREFLTEFLTSKDFLVAEAKNGKEALSVLTEKKVDLVITDIFMPEMSGIELAIKVKAKYPQLKIIGITAGGNQISSMEALDMSAIHFEYILKKPIDCEELIDNIKYLLTSDPPQ
ncbi:MAG: two-component system response regulator [Planctomycetota bacterium]|nr:MAG: two-component system response regulator [Planctomycetota bacterium]